MKKAFKIVLVVVIVVIVAACAIAADSRKKQTFHGVEFKLRESWERTLNKNVSTDNLLVYQPNEKKPDTLWIEYEETDLTTADLKIGVSGDNASELINFDEDYSILAHEAKKINGNTVIIIDASGLNGLTLQKIAIANADNGLVIFSHNYDSDEAFPETKEMDKIIKSIK